MKLTPPTQEDIPVLQKWLSDESLLRLIKVERPCFEKPMALLIIRLNDGTPVGWVELFNIDLENKKAEGGIAIPDPRGKGLAPLVGRRFLKMVFNEWRLNRVMARILASNTYAIKCAELFGFVREGVERQACFRDGKFEDVIVFGILKEDFERR